MQAVPYQTHCQYAKLSRPSLSTPAHATAWAICLGSKADPEAVDSRSAGVIDNQRRVIGKALRLVNVCRLRPRGDAGRGDLVILVVGHEKLTESNGAEDQLLIEI